jgi:tungstate transport system permease protein
MSLLRDVADAFLSGDQSLVQILGLTLALSLLSTGLSVLTGFPAGVLLASCRFPGRRLLRRLLQTLMGLPPVIAGLVVFLLLSRSGPLGSLNLLFSLPAMVIAQVVLIFPLIASLTLSAVEQRQAAVEQTVQTLGLSRLRVWLLLLWESRRALLTVIMSGFGRALSEVGAVMMVGGNIAGKTRVMTTAILLETNRGNFGPAIALGFVLLLLALLVNLLAGHFQEAAHD